MRDWLCLLLLSGCSSAPREPRPQVAVAPIAQEDASPPKREDRPEDLAFELQNVTVARAAELFTSRTGHKMIIAGPALPAANCLHISVDVGPNYRLESVVDAFDTALAGTGLSLARGSEAYEIFVERKIPPRRDCVP